MNTVLNVHGANCILPQLAQPARTNPSSLIQVAITDTTIGAAMPTAGNYSFKFTVTAKNASRSGYSLSFDDLTLTPQ